MNTFNPFPINALLPYPRKTENLWFSHAFRGNRKVTLTGNRLTSLNRLNNKQCLCQL